MALPSKGKGKELIINIIQFLFIVLFFAVLFIYKVKINTPWYTILKIAKYAGGVIALIFLLGFLWHIYTAIFKEIK